VEFKGDPVAFLYQSSIEKVSLSKSAGSIFLVVAMLAVSLRTGEYLIDISGRVLKVLTMPIDVIQE
jgi:hypothetical protein